MACDGSKQSLSEGGLNLIKRIKCNPTSKSRTYLTRKPMTEFFFKNLTLSWGPREKIQSQREVIGIKKESNFKKKTVDNL